MKKILIIITFICIVLSMSSCELHEQKVTKDSSTEQIEVAETSPYVDISSLKSMSDVRALDIEQFDYCGYAFFAANGKWYVAEEDVEDIFRIEEYTPFRVTSEAFGKITEGMDVYQMVEVAGLPKDSVTSGMTSMELYADDGTRARVYFWHYPVRDDDGNPLYSEMKVTSVNIYPLEEATDN